MSEMKALTTGTGAIEEEKIDNNDRIINSMQSLRESFISQLTKDGKLPSDKEDREVLLALMNSATNAALGNKKIKAAEKSAASQNQIIQTLAEAVRIGRSTESAERRKTLTQLREVPVVEIKPVPGNTDIGCFPISTTSIANGGDGHIEKD